MWACCCGLDVITTFSNYDIKNLIVMRKAHSNKPTSICGLKAHINWTCGHGNYVPERCLILAIIFWLWCQFCVVTFAFSCIPAFNMLSKLTYHYYDTMCFNQKRYSYITFAQCNELLHSIQIQNTTNAFCFVISSSK